MGYYMFCEKRMLACIVYDPGLKKELRFYQWRFWFWLQRMMKTR